MSKNERRTVTSDEVLVDELRETDVDRRLARTHGWLAMIVLLIVILAVAIEISS